MQPQDAAAAQAEQQREAAVQREDPEKRLDETIPGGKFLVGDQLVNAEGQPIDDSGKVKGT